MYESVLLNIETKQFLQSLQLAIQHAIGGLASAPECDLLMKDFMVNQTLNFPCKGSSSTPAHHYRKFTFKSYAPIAFQHLRALFGMGVDDFLIPICNSPLWELPNPGASGSRLYLTQNQEFMIKTMLRKESAFFQSMLPGYFMNFNQNPRSMLPKYLGLYSYRKNNGNIKFLVMKNHFPPHIKLHQKYDLKGSTFKRRASASELAKASSTLKDLDFLDDHPDGIFLRADDYKNLVKVIERDCKVLESFKIIDYSLLLGILNLDRAIEETDPTSTKNTNEPGSVQEDSAPIRSSIDANNIEPAIDDFGGIPAKNSKGERLLVFLGLIDILQRYKLKKKFEHTWKLMMYNGDTISVQKPGFYARRFQNFITKTVFKEVSSQGQSSCF